MQGHVMGGGCELVMLGDLTIAVDNAVFGEPELEVAGFRNAMYAGLDAVVPLYATKTELGAKFRDTAQRNGIPAATRWRSGQFKE